MKKVARLEDEPMFDVETFRSYKAETNPIAKQKRLSNLVKSQMPLAKNLIWKMTSKMPSNIEKEDLDQAGAIALQRAIEKYDPEKSAFSTYASYWIFAEVKRGLKEQFPDISLDDENNYATFSPVYDTLSDVWEGENPDFLVDGAKVINEVNRLSTRNRDALLSNKKSELKNRLMNDLRKKYS